METAERPETVRELSEFAKFWASYNMPAEGLEHVTDWSRCCTTNQDRSSL
jgi:hypothetical protein